MSALTKQYGYFVFVLSVHPDILPLMQQLRTRIFHAYNKLTEAEKEELFVYDSLLLHQASSPCIQGRDVQKPLEQWWWHLDLVANGSLYVCAR